MTKIRGFLLCKLLKQESKHIEEDLFQARSEQASHPEGDRADQAFLRRKSRAKLSSFYENRKQLLFGYKEVVSELKATGSYKVYVYSQVTKKR